MASMSLGESIVNLMTYTIWSDTIPQSVLCQIQGIVLQFTQIAQFGWITVVAVNLYLVVSSYGDIKRLEKYYHFLVWTLSSLSTLIPTFTRGSYGRAGVWCWLTKDGSVYHQWTLFYIPLSIMWCTVVFFYIMVIRTVHLKLGQAVRFSQSNHSNYDSVSSASVANVEAQFTAKKATRLNHLLRAYPAIFVIIYTFPLINRIHNALGYDDVYFLWIMQALTAPLLGFSNAVAFFLEKKPVSGNFCYSSCFYSCCCPDRGNPISIVPEEWSSEEEKIVFSNGP